MAIRVMMEGAFNVTSAVKTFVETLYFKADFQTGQSSDIPVADECATYVAAGGIEINGKAANEFSMAILDGNPNITVTATQDSRIALVDSEAIGYRHLFWNFVPSRKERIKQAKDNWKNSRFGKVPGDREEFITLPE